MYSNCPRFPVRIIQQAVGLLIVDETLRFRIPFQLTLQLHRDMCHHADGIRAVSHLDRCHRVLPAAHALQEVPHVVGALVKLDFIILDLLAQDFPVGCIDSAPLDEYPTLFALETNPCWISGFLDQADPIGVYRLRAICGMDVKKPPVRKGGLGWISTGPVSSVPLPHWAMSFMWEPQPVIIPRQYCSI